MTNEEAMLREIFGAVCFAWLTQINAGAEERKEEGESKEDADPVRHGKWVGGDGKPKRDSFSVYCSACGKWSEYRTKYCGECGAKMDGE